MEDLATAQEVLTLEWVIQMLKRFPAEQVIGELEKYKCEIGG